MNNQHKPSKLYKVSHYIEQKLNMLDTYGTPIHLNFNGKDEFITSAFGGLASIFGVSAIGFYVILQMITLLDN